MTAQPKRPDVEDAVGRVRTKLSRIREVYGAALSELAGEDLDPEDAALVLGCCEDILAELARVTGERDRWHDAAMTAGVIVLANGSLDFPPKHARTLLEAERAKVRECLGQVEAISLTAQAASGCNPIDGLEEIYNLAAALHARLSGEG